MSVCLLLVRVFLNNFRSYFVAASPSSIDRHIYSAKIPDLTSPARIPEEPRPLTDSRQSSWYSASFSPRSGFYSLSYSGPGVPWQKIVQVDKPGTQYLLVSFCSKLNALPRLSISA